MKGRTRSRLTVQVSVRFINTRQAKIKYTKKCREVEVGHVEKYCIATEDDCLFIGDLPPSHTEEDVKILVKVNGGLPVNVRSGLDKFGSRWALVNMEPISM